MPHQRTAGAGDGVELQAATLAGAHADAALDGVAESRGRRRLADLRAEEARRAWRERGGPGYAPGPLRSG